MAAEASNNEGDSNGRRNSANPVDRVEILSVVDNVLDLLL